MQVKGIILLLLEISLNAIFIFFIIKKIDNVINVVNSLEEIIIHILLKTCMFKCFRFYRHKTALLKPNFDIFLCGRNVMTSLHKE